jgi:ubiquinone/menaquinone biosynthesis C-methylase UbiE
MTATTNDNTLVTQAFTELAPDYRQSIDAELRQYWGVGYEQFVEDIVHAACLLPGERVLDIATGSARIPQAIRDQNNGSQQVVGLDITPAMLAQGRDLLDTGNGKVSIRLVCASGMQMPFDDGAFDVAICGLGTHHMHVPKLLGEIRRVLARAGRVVLADVGATPFWRWPAGKLLLRLLLLQYGWLQGSARARAEIEAFQNVRTADEWRALLHKSGFSQVRIQEIPSRRPWYPCGLTLTAQR